MIRKYTLEETITQLAELSLQVELKKPEYQYLYNLLVTGVAVTYIRERNEIIKLLYDKRKVIDKFKNGG